MKRDIYPKFELVQTAAGKLSKRFARAAIFGISILLLSFVCSAAIVDRDNGGITIWVSYESDIYTEVTQHDYNCTAATEARGGYCPGSCPVGNSCRGIEKLTGDINRLAEYIYGSTQGRHHLRNVYVTDNSLAWTTADIRWHTSGNCCTNSNDDCASAECDCCSSNSAYDGWLDNKMAMEIRNTGRRCIHDELHHEFGHYMYGLPDRYKASYSGKLKNLDPSVNPYLDLMKIDISDSRSVMGVIYPHFFVDTTNSRLNVTYDLRNYEDPGKKTVVLEPSILEDSALKAATPYRSYPDMPFASDEWSLMLAKHIDLTHELGDFSLPPIDQIPPLQISFYPDGVGLPGYIMLLDGSNDFGPGTAMLQESALHFQHSSRENSFSGTYVFSDSAKQLTAYERKKPTFAPPALIPPSGKKNIAPALKQAIDDFSAAHNRIVHGAQIILVSGDEQSISPDLVQQVGRARSEGIRIHTVSIGFPISGVMRQIAESTGGSNFSLPQNTNSEGLKSDLERILTRLHGFQTEAVYPSDTKEMSRSGQPAGRRFEFKDYFDIPFESSALSFYVFDKSNSKANFSIELQPPDAGDRIVVPADGVAKLGKFVGARIEKPKRGSWKFRVLASQQTPGGIPKDIEVFAYIEKLGLQTTVDLRRGEGTAARKGVITASLENPHRLINMEVKATIKGAAPPITLYDDGKSSGDKVANDGKYTGLFDLDIDSGEIHANVEFTLNKTSVPSQWVLYEPGADYLAIKKEYEALGTATFGSINKSRFTVYAQATALLGDSAAPKPDFESVTNSTQGTLKPGDTGTLKVQLSSARPLFRDMRLSLGQGIEITDASLSSKQNILKSDIQIEYKVLSKATKDVRHLRLQFGPHLLEKKNVFSIDN